MSCEKDLHDVFEEYKFSTSSLLGMFFYEDRGKAYIDKIELYCDSEENYRNGIVKCLGLDVRNNSYIFLNPLSFHSLEIGKRDERDEWFENVPNMEQNVLMDYNPQKLIYKEIILG